MWGACGGLARPTRATRSCGASWGHGPAGTVSLMPDDLVWVAAVREQFNTVMVGQGALLERLLTALITGNHVLIEGVPGLAKRSPS